MVNKKVFIPTDIRHNEVTRNSIPTYDGAFNNKTKVKGCEIGLYLCEVSF